MSDSSMNIYTLIIRGLRLRLRMRTGRIPTAAEK